MKLVRIPFWYRWQPICRFSHTTIAICAKILRKLVRPSPYWSFYSSWCDDRLHLRLHSYRRMCRFPSEVVWKDFRNIPSVGLSPMLKKIRTNRTIPSMYRQFSSRHPVWCHDQLYNLARAACCADPICHGWCLAENLEEHSIIEFHNLIFGQNVLMIRQINSPA